MPRQNTEGSLTSGLENAIGNIGGVFGSAVSAVREAGDDLTGANHLHAALEALRGYSLDGEIATQQAKLVQFATVVAIQESAPSLFTDVERAYLDDINNAYSDEQRAIADPPVKKGKKAAPNARRVWFTDILNDDGLTGDQYRTFIGGETQQIYQLAIEVKNSAPIEVVVPIGRMEATRANLGKLLSAKVGTKVDGTDYTRYDEIKDNYRAVLLERGDGQGIEALSRAEEIYQRFVADSRRLEKDKIDALKDEMNGANGQLRKTLVGMIVAGLGIDLVNLSGVEGFLEQIGIEAPVPTLTIPSATGVESLKLPSQLESVVAFVDTILRSEAAKVLVPVAGIGFGVIAVRKKWIYESVMRLIASLEEKKVAAFETILQNGPQLLEKEFGFVTEEPNLATVVGSVNGRRLRKSPRQTL